jgi:hypothetical protein
MVEVPISRGLFRPEDDEVAGDVEEVVEKIEKVEGGDEGVVELAFLFGIFLRCLKLQDDLWVDFFFKTRLFHVLRGL